MSEIERRDDRAVLLTGTLGSGKTVLAVEVGEVLEERGVPYAVIDLDWIGWVYAGPGGDEDAPFRLIVENLTDAWPRFRAAGARRLVMARMVENREQVDALRRALPGVALAVVRVDASPETAAARLRARDAGATLDHHLEESAAFRAVVERAGVEDIVVSNDGRPIREVALEVLDRVGWLG
jgi:dephospho-CoA kinase